MKNKLAFYFSLGCIFLYSGMTCVYVPPVYRMTLSNNVNYNNNKHWRTGTESKANSKKNKDFHDPYIIEVEKEKKAQSKRKKGEKVRKIKKTEKKIIKSTSNIISEVFEEIDEKNKNFNKKKLSLKEKSIQDNKESKVIIKKNTWRKIVNIKNILKKQTLNNYINTDIFKVPLPTFTRGIYLSNNSGRSLPRMKKFIKQAKRYNINTFVIDVQNKMIPTSTIKLLLKNNIFPVARVVVFHGGLKTKYPSKKLLKRIFKSMISAAKVGFREVQLDYIRYADAARLRRLPLKFKYKVIDNILKKAAIVAKKMGIFLSADVFGRITLNKNDHIGQKLETFATHMQTIYPMVYPSHYSFDKKRISDPYGTVHEAMLKSKKRLQNTRVVAYIQGFKMKYRQSKLSYVNYIKAQIRACEKSKSDGFIIWNPRNAYGASYKAIASHYKLVL